MGGSGMVCVTTVGPLAPADRVVTVRLVVTTRRTRFTFFTGVRTA